VLLEVNAVRSLILICSLFALYLAVSASSAADDSPKVAETRKKLTEKVTVEFKDTKISDVISELKEMTNVSFRLKAGEVSNNLTITFKAKDVTLAEALDGMFKKNGLGYFVITKEKAYEGSVLIKQGKERGYEAGQEPDKTVAKKEEKSDKKKSAGKDKAESKEKAKAEPKEEPKEKETKPTEDEEEKTERMASIRLKSAKGLAEDGKTDRAREICDEIVKKYPKTKAAEEAKKLREKLDQ